MNDIKNLRAKTSAKGSIILSTFPSKKIATKAAMKLLEEKLCACVNIWRVNSLYTWKGKVQREYEFLCLFKTTTHNLTKSKKLILDLHPYEVPEVVEVKMNSVDNDYLNWMASVTLPSH